MKRGMVLLIGFAAAALSWAGAVPNQITYQGTIKEQGVPVTGTRSMVFRFTSPDGHTQYGPSISSQVVVTDGLFAIDLIPTGVDWQNVTPSVVLAVAPQSHAPGPTQEFPPQPIASTAYSLMSGTVIDGSITLAKLDSTVIPAGTIWLFTGISSPTGWLLCDGKSYLRSQFINLFNTIGTRWSLVDDGVSFNVPDMQGRVPVGAGPGAGLSVRKLGETFGNETHVLSIAEMPKHQHTIADPAPGEYGLLRRSKSGDVVTVDSTDAIDSGNQADLIQTPRGATTDFQGSSQPHPNMPPSVVLAYIIKT